MAYLDTLMRADKNFLMSVFAKHAAIGEAFEKFHTINTAFRFPMVLQQMRQVERRLWQDYNIPAEHRETLGDHVADMLYLAGKFPVAPRTTVVEIGKNGKDGFASFTHVTIDHDKVIDMIGLWGAPLALAGEIPFYEMGPDDRKQLRSLAANVAFAGETQKAYERRTLWKKLAGEVAHNGPDDKEAEYVSDLDFIATARRARVYQDQFPALTGSLENLINNCRDNLKTSEGVSRFYSALDDRPRITVDTQAKPRQALLQLVA